MDGPPTMPPKDSSFESGRLGSSCIWGGLDSRAKEVDVLLVS